MVLSRYIIMFSIATVLVLFMSMSSYVYSVETPELDTSYKWTYNVVYSDNTTATIHTWVDYSNEYQQWIIVEDTYIDDTLTREYAWFVFNDWTTDYVITMTAEQELHWWVDDPVPFYKGFHPSHVGEEQRVETIRHFYDAINDQYLFNHTYVVEVKAVDEANVVYRDHVIPVYIVNYTSTAYYIDHTDVVTWIYYINNDFILPFIIIHYVNNELYATYELIDYSITPDPINNYPIATTTSPPETTTTTTPTETTTPSETTTTTPTTTTPTETTTISPETPTKTTTPETTSTTPTPTTTPTSSPTTSETTTETTTSPTSPIETTTTTTPYHPPSTSPSGGGGGGAPVAPGGTPPSTEEKPWYTTTTGIIVIAGGIGGAAVIGAIAYMFLHKPKPPTPPPPTRPTYYQPPPTQPPQQPPPQQPMQPPPTTAPQQVQPSIPQPPPGKKICPYCGAVIPAKARFCPRCGSKLV